MASPPQFTASQVLDAARRAEAEGKTDYAIQFYRHVVNNHAGEPEAVEARDGFLRLTQQRRNETVRQRHSPYGSSYETAGSHSVVTSAGQPRAAGITSPPPIEWGSAPGQNYESANLPQVITKASQLPETTEPEFAFRDRYRAGTFMAYCANWLGWIAVGIGTALAGAGAVGAAGGAALAGVPKALADPDFLGLPSGVIYGIEAAAAGLALVFISQLALAMFDNANASRHLLAIERAKAQL